MPEFESSQLKIIDLNQTYEVIEGIKTQLENGNQKGSGKFRFGIQGDIENILGWHDQHSPQTPLTDEQRITVLKGLKAAAEKSSQAAEMSGLVKWLDERTEELVLRQVDQIIDQLRSNPETQQSQAAVLLGQISDLESAHKEILGYQDSHAVASQQGATYTEEHMREAVRLAAEIKKKKTELYQTLQGH